MLNMPFNLMHHDCIYIWSISQTRKSANAPQYSLNSAKQYGVAITGIRDPTNSIIRVMLNTSLKKGNANDAGRLQHCSQTSKLTLSPFSRFLTKPRHKSLTCTTSLHLCQNPISIPVQKWCQGLEHSSKVRSKFKVYVVIDVK
jgi:hypothetical protein